MGIAIADLTVGQEIGSATVEVTRQDLVKYAGASGDFNPIHWNADFAQGVGLPGVIAHGMFTMGAAVQLVTDWVGDPTAVVDYQTRFTKPVIVEDTTAAGTPGAVIEVAGKIGAIDLDNSTVRVDLTVLSAGLKVLVKAQAVVHIW
ncbi:acyl dehydratase [Arthrobacter sp. CAN_A212]|uniref:MaoC family dehydratase n=1 Tax=unclassified Arthrobacter TaxID=235627 RepID=UPI0018CA3807|nr:MaoC family dehydratase [Arthrobacter sp. CAN_C5]MBP2215639.1 acyl dehydratase [Arthrobacter sp. CAN_C5]